jgi:ABC-type Mn2+/Zn2+ transport system ATPase subunit
MENINIEDHINNLIDIRDSIKLNEVTILTGDNATGKSVIRKTLWQHINDLLGIEEQKSFVSDISMERRTGLHPELGGGGIFLRDCGWTPTSMETYGFIKGVFQALNNDKRFIVLDEPEIGASKEVQKAFAKYINNFYEEIHDNNKCYGLLVITHSDEIIKNLKCDNFLNIQGLTKEEYLNREIKDIDLEEIKKFSLDLFCGIRDRNKTKKKHGV